MDTTEDLFLHVDRHLVTSCLDYCKTITNIHLNILKYLFRGLYSGVPMRKLLTHNVYFQFQSIVINNIIS